MNTEQIHEALHIQPQNNENIYIPNSIFRDLIGCGQLKSASNIAFLYCYYGLICYLFRYCKYGFREYGQGDIKEILGYAANNKKLDFMIKKGGVLDQLRYTESIRDFPVSYTLNNDKFVEFTTYKGLDEDTRSHIKISCNFTVKYPVRAFYKDDTSQNEEVYDGTFYEIENTHLFNVQVFADIVGNEQLGVVAFYLYQYLSYRMFAGGGEYTKTYELLESETGIGRTTIFKYIKLLYQYGYIDKINNGYRQHDNESGDDEIREKDKRRDVKMNPNTYMIRR